MSDTQFKPVVTKGRWTGPTVLPSWNQCVRDPNAQMTGAQLPAQIDLQDYPYTQYWANVQEEHERLLAKDDHEAMETEAQEDSYGVPLPDRPPTAPVKPKVNVRVVFDEQCNRIEKNFVPMGIINPDGTQFKFVMPPGHMGEQISKRVINVPFWVRQAASQRYRAMYEVYLILTKVMPVPLHTSPLALLIVREPGPVMRWRDAISTLHGLHIIRHAMHEMDTENQEHKTRCWNFYKTLESYVAERFFAELDRLAEEEKASGTSRQVAEAVARKFGDAVARFALDMVHAIEWCCMDILQLPYEWRHLFMTPNELPAGGKMSKIGFDQMRIQTIRYLVDRNKTYCGLYAEEEDPTTKAKKRTYKGIDPNAWCPMQLEQPPLADRPYLLREWSRTVDPQIAACCLFGIYNEWIDLHTLREYMRMLEVDSRPETAAKMAAYYARSEVGLNPDENAGKMDTGKDETEGEETLSAAMQ